MEANRQPHNPAALTFTTPIEYVLEPWGCGR